MTTLFEALARDDLQEASNLIEKGASVTSRDSDGRTVLMHAATQGKDAFVQLFIASGAGVNDQDNNGDSALHFASQGFKLSTVSLLLSKGANPNLVDRHGNGPLWRAVFHSRGRGEMIGLLLENGADRHAKNKSGKSPVDLAGTIGNYNLKERKGVGVNKKAEIW